MKHLGDITKISGYDAPVVDIVTGGSPCQDLSVAGKREGLAGERSGLFMEQIRIIKEMRENDRRNNGKTDEHIRPRYMVWENVPGAFSSNKGEDFRCVLEETAKVADSNATIPRLETDKNGKQKWSKSGCIMGDGWSIAWRVHDAQFWGVPQRRKRIALVADFGGTTAPEILFERESVSWDTKEGGKEREGTTEDAERGIGETSRAVNFQERAGKPGGGKGILIQNDRTGALSTVNNQMVFDTSRRHDYQQFEDVCETVQAHYGTGGGNVPMVMMDTGSLFASGYDKLGTQEVANDMYIVQSMETFHCTSEVNKTQTLKARDYKDPQCVAYGLDQASFNQGINAQYDFKVEEEKIGTQVAKGPGAVCQSIVRRLTPMECERLQGFPDGWTDIGDWIDSKGKKHKAADSPRYKALGNSIALPFWEWMAERMVKQLKQDGFENPTMASLFDGISGFCLVYARVGCKPVFSSEIEEFPIAVAKKHFGDDDLGLEGDYEQYL